MILLLFLRWVVLPKQAPTTATENNMKTATTRTNRRTNRFDVQWHEDYYCTIILLPLTEKIKTHLAIIRIKRSDISVLTIGIGLLHRPVLVFIFFRCGRVGVVFSSSSSSVLVTHTNKKCILRTGDDFVLCSPGDEAGPHRVR